VIINIREGMRFGVGIDGLTESVRAYAVDSDGETTRSGGQHVGSDVVMIETQESLMEQLNISAGASIHYGLASLDARMEFASSHAINSHTLYVLLKSTVTNAARYMQNPRLSESARIAFQTDPENFRNIYGTHYIDEIYGGGAFFGLFAFETMDERSQNSLSIDLRASIGGFLGAGGEITASFQHAVETYKSKTNMSIHVVYDGGAGLQNPSSLEDLKSLYSAFARNVRDNAIDYQASLKEFRYLPLPAGRSWVEQLVRADTIEQCGKRVIDALVQRSAVDFILRYPQQFKPFNANELRRYREALEDCIPRWARRASACSENIDQCAFAEDEHQPATPTLPDRFFAADPAGAMEEKRAWLRSHDNLFDGYYDVDNLDGRTIQNDWQPGPRGGRYIIFTESRPLEGEPSTHLTHEVAGIYYHPDYGAFGVAGPAFEIYHASGGPYGNGGYPVSDDSYVEGWPDWRRQSFEKLTNWAPPQVDPVGDFNLSRDLAYNWRAGGVFYSYGRSTAAAAVGSRGELTQWIRGWSDPTFHP
jgi:hypothetical protein